MQKSISLMHISNTHSNFHCVTWKQLIFCSLGAFYSCISYVYTFGVLCLKRSGLSSIKGRYWRNIPSMGTEAKWHLEIVTFSSNFQMFKSKLRYTLHLSGYISPMGYLNTNIFSVLESYTDKVFEVLSEWMNIFNHTCEALASVTE